MAAELEKAIEYAVRMHAGSYRDGDQPFPYITHPIDVLNKLRFVGLVKDANLECAAALHDVVEDTEATIEEIERLFGRPVANFVQDMTRPEPSSDQIEGLSEEDIYELRTKMLLDHIKDSSPGGQILKLADRLSNLEQAFATRRPAKLRRYVEQSKQILEIIPKDVNPPLYDAIERLTLQPIPEEPPL